MPYISLEQQLPGITGLLEYRQDTAQPIRELTQFLLRGPNTLTEGERELIATLVSYHNECLFCTTAHTAAADLLIGNNTTSALIKKDIDNAPVTPKLKALLHIAAQVQKNGNQVTQSHINKAVDEGATDLEIHDTVLIAALFCLYNRYVDGLATAMPQEQNYFDVLADRLVNNGYKRPPEGFVPQPTN